MTGGGRAGPAGQMPLMGYLEAGPMYSFVVDKLDESCRWVKRGGKVLQLHTGFTRPPSASRTRMGERGPFLVPTHKPPQHRQRLPFGRLGAGQWSLPHSPRPSLLQVPCVRVG
jgi:hypothetical protein